MDLVIQLALHGLELAIRMSYRISPGSYRTSRASYRISASSYRTSRIPYRISLFFNKFHSPNQNPSGLRSQPPNKYETPELE
ncbi:hypothetical protein GIW82_06945 [Planomicrobium sp. YIM 101495]|nr:hypothetical protein [Planomicrobium sp. YIM 101495]